MNYCLEPVPNIYYTSKIPHTVQVSEKLIEDQTARGLPYILSIKIDQVFYFTINSKEDSTFKYLGHSKERDPKKLLFLATFLEANTGNACAQTRLAEMYFEGFGTQPHIGQAIKYYTLATQSF